MTDQLAGKVVVITGAASGIGAATATLVAERGARVVGVDLAPQVADAMAALPGDGHASVVADLVADGAAERAVADAERLAGPVDVLVNSAGVALLDPAVDVPRDRWQTVLDVNLTASFLAAQAAGRRMVQRGSGRIVFLASQAAVIGLPEHAAYCASKAAILGLTRVLSLEWAPHGVTVNAVSPTVVETPLGLAAWAGEKGERARAQIPVGRFAQPREVAALIAYLAGDDAAMVTGANLTIDGGRTTV